MKKVYKSKMLSYFLFGMSVLLVCIVLLLTCCSYNKNVKLKQDCNSATQEIEINSDVKIKDYGN